MVVGDARLDSRFSESKMIQDHDIKSIACIPALSQGKLKTMLYLENRQVTDVFNVENLETLKHLSSQFAVSVENALLYENLNQTVRKLQEGEERYELAVAGSSAGLWDWDLRSDEMHYSDRLKELLGYRPDEFPDTLDEFWNRLHPDELDAVRERIDRHIKLREPYIVDFRLRNKTGEYRWFHARGQALWDETDQAIRMSGSITDITERKRAEEELSDSERRFRAVMEQSPLAIELLSPDGRIRQMNSAWMRMWGVNEEEAEQVVSKYNMLTDQQAMDLGVGPLIRKAFAGEAVILPPIEYSSTRTAEDLGVEPIEGKTPWIQCHLFPVKNENQEILFVVNTYVEITELKRAEEEASRHQDALARVDRTDSMGQLTGSIAHELNQPLTGILSNAQAAELLLKSGQWEQAELEEILSEIVADTKRGGEVIQNLRELFREQNVEFLAVDINSVVHETTLLLHSEFVLQNVMLKTDLDTTIPLGYGNRIQLQQVLVNLIMNGIQAMGDIERENRRLLIATDFETNEIKVWVDDCGPGIDSDKIDHIFEPLATWKPGGTGMGLAISNSIIQSHGGRMWAENKPEGGARVGFALLVPEEGEKS